MIDYKQLLPYNKDWVDTDYVFYGLRLLHPELLVTWMQLNAYFASHKLMANNWSVGGPYNHRGYRAPESTVGAKGSAHKKGMAVDFDVMDLNGVIVDPAKVRKEILRKRDFFRYVKGIEVEVSWNHIDVMQRKGVKIGGIALFNERGLTGIV